MSSEFNLPLAMTRIKLCIFTLELNKHEHESTPLSHDSLIFSPIAIVYQNMKWSVLGYFWTILNYLQIQKMIGNYVTPTFTYATTIFDWIYNNF